MRNFYLAMIHFRKNTQLTTRGNICGNIGGKLAETFAETLAETFAEHLRKHARKTCGNTCGKLAETFAEHLQKHVRKTCGNILRKTCGNMCGKLAETCAENLRKARGKHARLCWNSCQKAWFSLRNHLLVFFNLRRFRWKFAFWFLEMKDCWFSGSCTAKAHDSCIFLRPKARRILCQMSLKSNLEQAPKTFQMNINTFSQYIVRVLMVGGKLVLTSTTWGGNLALFVIQDIVETFRFARQNHAENLSFIRMCHVEKVCGKSCYV